MTKSPSLSAPGFFKQCRLADGGFLAAYGKCEAAEGGQKAK